MLLIMDFNKIIFIIYKTFSKSPCIDLCDVCVSAK